MRDLLVGLLLTLSLTYLNCGEPESEDVLIGAVNVSVEMKEWKNAADLLFELLEEYPDSKFRENYYYSLNEVLGEQEYEIRHEHAKTNPPDTSKPRGSITLVLSEDYGLEAREIINEKIEVAKKYLEEFPNGKFKDAFYRILANDYKAIGNKLKAVKISEQLFNSSKKQNKIIGAITLGYYAHAAGKYDDATEYYAFVYENSHDLITKIKFSFYTAVCFYKLNNLKKSKRYLNNVFKLSKRTDNKNVNKIAKIMLDHINKFENNSNMSERQFVFFVDEAIE